MGDIIVMRQLEILDVDGKVSPISVQVGRPVEMPEAGGYCCPFQLHGFGTGNPKWSRGVDAMDALQRALAALDAEVCIIGCNFQIRRAGEGDGHTGFREMPLLRETWEAWFTHQQYERAVCLARPLAESGVAFAQKVLGFAKWLGWGTPIDALNAVEWLRKAAEQGEADACDILAGIYMNGAGVPANHDLAKRYREMAQYYGIQM